MVCWCWQVGFFDQLKELIQNTAKTTHQRVVLVGDSLGSAVTTAFLAQQSKKWRYGLVVNTRAQHSQIVSFPTLVIACILSFSLF